MILSQLLKSQANLGSTDKFIFSILKRLTIAEAVEALKLDIKPSYAAEWSEQGKKILSYVDELSKLIGDAVAKDFVEQRLSATKIKEKGLASAKSILPSSRYKDHEIKDKIKTYIDEANQKIIVSLPSQNVRLTKLKALLIEAFPKINQESLDRILQNMAQGASQITESIAQMQSELENVEIEEDVVQNMAQGASQITESIAQMQSELENVEIEEDVVQHMAQGISPITESVAQMQSELENVEIGEDIVQHMAQGISPITESVAQMQSELENVEIGEDIVKREYEVIESALVQQSMFAEPKPTPEDSLVTTILKTIGMR